MICKEPQLAYLAGIIDGEGTFYLAKHPIQNKFFCRIYVVNTDEKLIKWLQENFGGLVYKRNSIKNPHWKTKFEWVIDKCKIDPICHRILPYLVIKKEHAETMIKFRKTFTPRKRERISEEKLSYRISLCKYMTQLNH